MHAMPAISFDPAMWPDPAPDGSVILDAKASFLLLQVLLTLEDYVETEYARCAAPPSLPTDGSLPVR